METYFGVLKSTDENFVIAHTNIDNSIRVMSRQKLDKTNDEGFSAKIVGSIIPTDAFNIATTKESKSARWIGDFDFDNQRVILGKGYWE